MYYALPYLDSSYILMSDNWIEKNIFNTFETRSWFSCLFFEGMTHEWCVTASPTGKIESISIGGRDAWAVVGPAYFSPSFSSQIRQYTVDYYKRPETADFYWEHILKENINSLPMYMNKQTGNVHEFENLEELRMFDPSYNTVSNNKIMEGIAGLFAVSQEKIQNIIPVKKGLLNDSFMFSIDSNYYIYRIPGVGADKVANRDNEKKVYDAIAVYGISDDIVSFDVASGLKISRFIANTRTADPFNDNELEICMRQIRNVHHSGISVPCRYDIEEKISCYISLAEGLSAIRFSDIGDIKKKVQRLLAYRRSFAVTEALCHGDFSCVNVLLLPDNSCRLIDWEFGGMADPLMDVAMYGIFAKFDKERLDFSLKLYLGREPSEDERIRLYVYVGLGAFMWCIFSQYMQALGHELGEYPLAMYRYVKDFYNLLADKLSNEY